MKKPETINYRTLKPEKDGLFCEKIFGPTKDWECACGKYKRVRFKGIVCERCGVEVTRSKVRRERMGHIELAAPVSHIWYFKGIPSRMGMLLDISPRTLEKVLYFANFIVLDPGDPNETGLKKHELITDARYREIEARCGAGSFRAGMGAEAVKEMLMELDLDAISEKLKKEIAEIGKLVAAAKREETKMTEEKEERKAEIAIDDFSKIDLRVALVTACEKVEKTDKLLKLTVKLGEEMRTVVSGIAKFYTPEEMVGKRVVMIANLKPAKLRGIESRGMILCAEDAEGNLSLVSPEKAGFADGSGIF